MGKWSPVFTLKAWKKIALVGALEYHQGNKTKAASSLGISTKSIYNMLELYGLQGDPEKFEKEKQAVLETESGDGMDSESAEELPLPMRQRQEVQGVSPLSNAAYVAKAGKKR